MLQAQLSPHLQSGPQAQAAVWHWHGSQVQGSQGQLFGIGKSPGLGFQPDRHLLSDLAGGNVIVTAFYATPSPNRPTRKIALVGYDGVQRTFSRVFQKDTGDAGRLHGAGPDEPRQGSAGALRLARGPGGGTGGILQPPALHRGFLRRLNATPGEYRQGFGAVAPGA